MEFFYTKTQTFCIRSQVMRADFSKTFGEAVRRRTYPNTGLHLAQLAGAIGCHVETLKNAVRGQHNISSHLLAGCIDFFARSDDHTFLQELFPSAVTPLIQRAKRGERALAFVESFKDVFAGEGAAA